MRRLSLAVLLLGASPAFAAPPEVPPTLAAEPGEITELVVKPAAGKDFGYAVVGPKSAFREMRSDAATERVFWFHAKTAGTYTVVWWTVGEKVSARTVITVGGEPPIPDPKPVPPKPPAPVDPLVQLLADAYATEAAVDRRERMRALAGVMRFGATAANDPNHTLNVHVSAAVSKERTAKVGDSLPAVRKAIGAYLGGELGDVVIGLDAPGRAKISAAYTRLAVSLEEVSK